SDDQDSDDADHPRPIHLSSLGQDEDAEGGVEDVIVVGGGVAGLAATRWCLRLGHAPLLIDPGPRLGGQLHLVHAEMTDLPALSPHAGLALARRLWRQLPTRTRWLETHLVRVSSDPQGLSLAVEAADGTRAVLRARTLILAMGLRRRYLGVPGERELAGCGILQTASKEIACVAGDRVVVVGGGDGACENALKLADAGAEPVLVHRGARLSARRALRDAVVSQEIPVRFETRVRRFLGDAGRLVAVELESGERVASPWALVRVGWVPQSASLPAAWRDDRGYVVCDAGLRVAGEARVFVAGDLRDPPAPSVASSCGDGASAAKAAIQRIEAMDDDDRA
ncbi:MAG: NAD(P)/FAD-dependent oxidoreductase, partial [Deltaproteobacteria bacterium]|nr:NAD(P)/FAD-dependent oxidoreductase [Deltaproteobacteria bacterium]